MSRHLADRPRIDGTAARLARFLRLDRLEQRHPAVRALYARRPALPAEGRLKPFLRILRDRSS